MSPLASNLMSKYLVVNLSARSTPNGIDGLQFSQWTFHQSPYLQVVTETTPTPFNMR